MLGVASGSRELAFVCFPRACVRELSKLRYRALLLPLFHLSGERLLCFCSIAPENPVFESASDFSLAVCACCARVPPLSCSSHTNTAEEVRGRIRFSGAAESSVVLTLGKCCLFSVRLTLIDRTCACLFRERTSFSVYSRGTSVFSGALFAFLFLFFRGGVSTPLRNCQPRALC